MNISKPVFTRHRTLEELRAVLKKEGWKLNTELFDKGDDGVSFRFQVGRTQGLCVFNTFNGKFVGSLDGSETIFSSSSGEHDNCRWFQKLLAVCLVAEQPAKSGDAYGHEVEIEVATGVASSKVVTKHWRLKHASQARNRAMQVANAHRVLKVTPLTEKEWIAAYGDPRMKAES